MPFEASCPACGKSYRLKDELEGKKIRCKDCGNIFPAKKIVIEVLEDEEPVVAVRKQPRQAPREEIAEDPKRKPPESDEPEMPDDPDLLPRRKKKPKAKKIKASTKRLLLMVAGLSFLFCLGCPTFGLGIWWLGGGQAILLDVTGSWPKVHHLRPPAESGVTLHIAGVPNALAAQKTAAKMQALLDQRRQGASWSHDGDRMTVFVEPVDDLDALVRKINFGRVHRVSGRTITMTADSVEMPSGKDDFEVAVNLLKSSDFKERQSGIRMLETAAVGARRAEVLKILEGQLDGSEGSYVSHILVKLNAKESVPALAATLLAKKSSGNSVSFIVALGDLGDARGAPALAAMLETLNAPSAAMALKKMGSIAEDAVVPKLKSTNAAARGFAHEVLRSIATERSVPALEAMSNDPNRDVQNAAKQLVKLIRSKK
jgi:hypothetical protein